MQISIHIYIYMYIFICVYIYICCITLGLYIYGSRFGQSQGCVQAISLSGSKDFNRVRVRDCTVDLTQAWNIDVA